MTGNHYEIPAADVLEPLSAEVLCQSSHDAVESGSLDWVITGSGGQDGKADDFTCGGMSTRTSITQDGNSTFPTSGYRTGTELYLKGLYGYYWSSSLTVSKPCNASCLYFSQHITFANNGEINNRCYGQSIRPVSD